MPGYPALLQDTAEAWQWVCHVLAPMELRHYLVPTLSWLSLSGEHKPQTAGPAKRLGSRICLLQLFILCGLGRERERTRQRDELK